MRIYEELFIVKPDATEEEVDALIDQVKSTVANSGGTIDKEEKWGVRKLAYKVQKRAEGYYVLIQFTAGPQTVHEIERRLRVSDSIMKFRNSAERSWSLPCSLATRALPPRSVEARTSRGW